MHRLFAGISVRYIEIDRRLDYRQRLQRQNETCLAQLLRYGESDNSARRNKQVNIIRIFIRWSDGIARVSESVIHKTWSSPMMENGRRAGVSNGEEARVKKSRTFPPHVPTRWGKLLERRSFARRGREGGFGGVRGKERKEGLCEKRRVGTRGWALLRW